MAQACYGKARHIAVRVVINKGKRKTPGALHG